MALLKDLVIHRCTQQPFMDGVWLSIVVPQRLGEAWRPDEYYCVFLNSVIPEWPLVYERHYKLDGKDARAVGYFERDEAEQFLYHGGLVSLTCYLGASARGVVQRCKP